MSASSGKLGSAGSHCAPEHIETLRALGVGEIAPDFATVAALLDLD